MTEAKITGFVGIECYDILHYVSQVLKQLECRVLLVDNSASRSLAFANDYVAIDGENTVYDYNGVDVIVGCSDKELFAKYDYVYVYYDSAVDSKDLEICEEIFAVVDYQKHNYSFLKDVNFKKETPRFLIIRDYPNTKFRPSMLHAELKHLNFSKANTFILEYNDVSARLMLLCQHTEIVNFSKIPVDFKELIIEMLKVDFEKTEINKALKVASKGV